MRPRGAGGRNHNEKARLVGVQGGEKGVIFGNIEAKYCRPKALGVAKTKSGPAYRTRRNDKPFPNFGFLFLFLFPASFLGTRRFFLNILFFLDRLLLCLNKTKTKSN